MNPKILKKIKHIKKKSTTKKVKNFLEAMDTSSDYGRL